MAIVFKLDGALLPYQTVRMVGADGGVSGLPARAWAGEPSVAGIQIEDPTGTLDIVGWLPFTVDETSCTSAPRIFTGWIFGKRVSRGKYRTGAGRIWDCDIIDQNEIFSYRCFRASSAKRPAETDIARIAFALSSAPLSGLFTITAYADVTNDPVAFGEANYIEQFPAELFLSVAGTSGKNFYAFYDEAIGATTIFYDLINSTSRNSTLRISNVLSDVDNSVTFAPLMDATLNRTPENQYDGVLLHWRGGYEYQQDPWGDTRPSRDLVYSTDRVGHLATAQALVAAIVDAHHDEQDTITLTIQLPATHVNLIHAGMRVQVKFSHLPDYSAGFTYLTVVGRNVVPTSGSQDMYDIQLELTTAALERGPGGGDPGGLPQQPPAAGTHWWEGSGSVNSLTGGVDNIGPAAPTFVAGTYSYQITIIETRIDSWITYATDVGFGEVSGAFTTESFHIDGTPSPGGDTTVYTGSFSVDGSGVVTEISASDIPGPTYTNNINFGVAHYFNIDTAGPHSGPYALTGLDTAVAFWFDLAGSGTEAPPPDTGQPVQNETPSLTSAGPPATYTTLWPYADGSLRVFVDNLDQTAAVTETDPATGEFTLAFTPRADETVRVWYLGR